MTKSYALFMLVTLGGAIYFYNGNSFMALICLLLFIGACYGAGKLG